MRMGILLKSAYGNKRTERLISLTSYKEILIMKKPDDYSEKEKAAFFQQIWYLALNYYDAYDENGGDIEDVMFEFRAELAELATTIVFPHAHENSIVKLIDELKEEED